ncbi:MAG: hypothetical protein GYA62_16825 [Bacteroidales bacterium]|nr:hypothetical protein [Bacteroidales bacterium]
MRHLLSDYFLHSYGCSTCYKFFYHTELFLQHALDRQHKHNCHVHCLNLFSEHLRYTNKLTEKPILENYLVNFQRNLFSYLPNLFLPLSYFELLSYRKYIEYKYIIPCFGQLQLVDAVVFVPKKDMKKIKTRIIVKGGHGIDNGGDNYPSSLIDPMAEELKDREFWNKEKVENREYDNNEPQFNEPKENENNGKIVVGGKIVGTKTWVETMSLLGCSCKMTLNKLHNEISKLKSNNVIYVDNNQITEKDLKNNGDDYLNVIFLCEETLKELGNSMIKNKKRTEYKKEMSNRFNVNILDGYFTYENALKLTFAHEVGHILWGHLKKTTKMLINCETQANFMASLMLNDKIDSIYMQYKTNFQPIEYQRTMLFHNDFNSTNFTKALLKVLKLK